VFLALFVYTLWTTTYPLQGLLPAAILFKADPLIMIMTSLSTRVLLPGIFIGLGFIAATAVLGRFFCGWVCPLGTFIDMAGSLGRFVPGGRNKRGKRPVQTDGKNRKTCFRLRWSNQLRWFKWIVLGLVFVLACLGIQFVWVVDPIVIAGRFVSLNLVPAVTWLSNRLFMVLVRDWGFDEKVYDAYRFLKETVLGAKVYMFASAGHILAIFVAITAVSLFMKRLWCRAFCPLGAVYSAAAQRAFLGRVVQACNGCGRCVKTCRMGAIEDGSRCLKGECVLCMDCVYICPLDDTKFSWRGGKGSTTIGNSSGGIEPDSVKRGQGDLSVKDNGNPTPESNTGKSDGMTRREFLGLAAASVVVLGAKSRVFAAADKQGAGNDTSQGVIRPPGVTDEEVFMDRCVRCGNCMKACPTNALQPVFLQSGLQGIWTPRLVPEIGYCEYNCTMCGTVCPTGAIPSLPLSEKQKTKLGLAQFDHSLCIPWAEGKQCIVCEEHCPLPQKAINLIEEKIGDVVLLKPYIETRLCIGCGLCQNKCPVRPLRAVRVQNPLPDKM